MSWIGKYDNQKKNNNNTQRETHKEEKVVNETHNEVGNAARLKAESK